VEHRLVRKEAPVRQDGRAKSGNPIVEAAASTGTLGIERFVGVRLRSLVRRSRRFTSMRASWGSSFTPAV